MEIELRFFASFREVVGRKVLHREYDAEELPVGEVLHDVVAEYPDLEVFTDDGRLRDYLNIMKNGRGVDLLDGLETPVGDGDRLSLFPPVAGG